MMQQPTLFEQPAVGPGMMLAASNHDLTAASFGALIPQQLSGGIAPHNVQAWESYPNMVQSTSDAADGPRTTPSSVAQLNTSVPSSAPSSSKAGASRRASRASAAGAASARSVEKPGATSASKSANGSFDSAASSSKAGQKRKAMQRKRTVIKEEEEEPEVAPSKRNKFLERNRVAASKCREKKKVWLHDLEETKHELELRHRGLRMEYESLMEEVTRIKNSLVNHACCSDPHIDTWIRNEAHKFVKRSAERAATPYYSSSSMSPPARESMGRSSPSSGHGGSTKWRSINYDHMPDDMSET